MAESSGVSSGQMAGVEGAGLKLKPCVPTTCQYFSLDAGDPVETPPIAVWRSLEEKEAAAEYELKDVHDDDAKPGYCAENLNKSKWWADQDDDSEEEEQDIAEHMSDEAALVTMHQWARTIMAGSADKDILASGL